ncbi:cobalt ECF transporter T component CbiQ [Cyanobacteria bacterium FACHB-63]|nr:cobalt ECF transporter T component CbiQ [Cyanobacteria bacterium FACHB-63]
MQLWIDTFSYRNRLRRLPPQQKVLFAGIVLVFALITRPIVQCAIALWMSIWIVNYAGIPSKVYGRMLSVAIAFWFTSIPALLIAGVALSERSRIQTDVLSGFSMGTHYLYLSQQGVLQAGLIFTRTIATVSSLYFLLLTTPFSEILQVMRQVRCPEILAELLLLMYRFIFILLSTASELWTAQHSRNGYRTYQRWYYSLSLLVSQLFRKTMENYRQFVLSTASRGFNGTFRVWSPQQYQPSRRYTIEAILGCFLLLLSLCF